eukprot:gb/GEZN01008029.1/.p1 GENE.gb/GEZN01008029.1/~~gb/GEZN01008029.1/.p1  ORF type:complete len:413 (-),score=61.80 gb/GEZN01008029.1/:236-1474(-)
MSEPVSKKQKTEVTPAIHAPPEIKEQETYMVEQRRHFHKYPELSFQEVKTAKHIADQLRNMGMQVYEKIGRTGVVAVLKGEKGAGPCILLRADMDALPLQETADKEYKSVNKDVMHACGHDGHMAILLGAAKALCLKKASLKGHVKFCFQPAEEGYHGAREMIQDGILEDKTCGPKVDQVFGLHLWSYSPLGKVIVNNGPMMAASDKWEIKVKGKGGHGAVPAGTADAIVASASLIQQLHTIVSRNICPTDKAVLTIGTVKAGYAYNIISDHAELTGTCRHMKEETFARMKERMQHICDGVSTSHEVQASLEYQRGYPCTENNHAPSVQLVRDVSTKVIGKENVVTFPGTLGAEDFSYFLQKRDGCFFFVGSAPNDEEEFPHHKSNFDLHEGSLLVGSSIFFNLITHILGRD